jgi:hypothetical protein
MGEEYEEVAHFSLSAFFSASLVLCSRRWAGVRKKENIVRATKRA